MASNPAARVIGLCCLAVIGALYVVGFVVHEIVRHVIQTSPIWIAVIMGLRGQGLVKWVAIPFLFFWGAISVLIWLFLLGWAHIVGGTYSPPEIAMTIVMAAAGALGLFTALRMKSASSPVAAILAFVTAAALQWVVFTISFQPAFAHDHFSLG
jgi:hypothetical protein